MTALASITDALPIELLCEIAFEFKGIPHVRVITTTHPWPSFLIFSGNKLWAFVYKACNQCLGIHATTCLARIQKIIDQPPIKLFTLGVDLSYVVDFVSIVVLHK